MSENRLNMLIKKYECSYVPGEIHSAETNKLNKQNQRDIEKHLICDELFDECGFLNLSPSQKEFIHYLISRFSNNFKYLHGRAKIETIILAFIFYVKKVDDSHVNLKNYSICKKYGLTDTIFILIICRMCDDFVKSSPIRYIDSNYYNHELLLKNGGKI